MTKSVSSEIKSQFLTFYKEEGRMPSYAEICALFGYKSKNAAFRLVKKLLDAGLLARILLYNNVMGTTVDSNTPVEQTPVEEPIVEDAIVEDDPIVEDGVDSDPITVGDGDGLADLAADDVDNYNWLNTDMPDDVDIEEPEQARTELNNLEEGDDPDEAWKSKTREMVENNYQKFGKQAGKLANQATTANDVIAAEEMADDGAEALEKEVTAEAEKEELTKEQLQKRTAFASDLLKQKMYKKGFFKNQTVNAEKFMADAKESKKLKLMKIYNKSSTEQKEQAEKKQNGKFQLKKINLFDKFLKDGLRQKTKTSKLNKLTAAKPNKGGTSKKELAKYKKAHGDQGVGGNKDLSKKEQKALKAQHAKLTSNPEDAEEPKTAKEMKNADKMARHQRQNGEQVAKQANDGTETTNKEVSDKAIAQKTVEDAKDAGKKLVEAGLMTQAQMDKAIAATTQRMADGAQAVVDSNVKLSTEAAIGHIQEKLYDKEKQGEGRADMYKFASLVLEGRRQEALDMVQAEMHAVTETVTEAASEIANQATSAVERFAEKTQEELQKGLNDLLGTFSGIRVWYDVAPGESGMSRRFAQNWTPDTKGEWASTEQGKRVGSGDTLV